MKQNPPRTAVNLIPTLQKNSSPSPPRISGFTTTTYPPTGQAICLSRCNIGAGARMCAYPRSGWRTCPHPAIRGSVNQRRRRKRGVRDLCACTVSFDFQQRSARYALCNPPPPPRPIRLFLRVSSYGRAALLSLLLARCRGVQGSRISP